MADPIKPENKPARASKKVEELQADQDKLRDELFILRNSNSPKPEDVAALKAKLADAVAATRAAEEATV